MEIISWSRRIFLQAGAFAVLVGFFSCFVSNRYVSEARLLPVESRSGSPLGSLSNAVGMLGISIPTVGTQDANMVEILRSRWLAMEVLDMPVSYTERSILGRAEEKSGRLMDCLRLKNLDMAVKTYQGLLSAYRDPKTSLLIVSVETKSPALSKQILANTLGALDKFLKTKNQTRGGNKSKYLTARLQEAYQNLTVSESHYLQFSNQNRNSSTSSDPAIRLAGQRLEMDLVIRRQLIASMESLREQAMAEEKNDMPILNMMDEPWEPTLKSFPSRVVWVFEGFLLATIVSFLYENRRGLKAWLGGGASTATGTVDEPAESAAV